MLEDQAAKLKSRLKSEEEEPEFGDDVDSFEEEGDEAAELSNKLGLQQNSKAELEEIDHALEKIEEGKYGICEKCGKEISEDVLKANPESRLCKECKKNQNLYESVKGFFGIR